MTNNYQISNERKQYKIFDLEERTFIFAKKVAFFVKKLPKTVTNIEYVKQLVRSSASVGANYIEANESLGKKDFLMRIKISRKEAKETAYWLRLLVAINIELEIQAVGGELLNEAVELKKILSAIIEKSIV